MASLLHVTQLASAGGGTGQGKPRLLVCVHSLLTSGSFLRPLAQKYIDAAASSTGAPWTAVLVDNRCHGQSLGAPGLDPPHTIDAMAEDVIRTLLQGQKDGRWGPADVLLGHSIGALIVMEVAQRLGRAAQQGSDGAQAGLAALGVPRQVWVVDGRALPVSANHPVRAEAAGLLAAFAAVPEPMPSPDSMVQALGGLLATVGAQLPPYAAQLCAQFVKSAPAGGGFVRCFDGAAIPQMLESYTAKSHRSLIEAPPPGCTLHFAAGLSSSLWAGDAQEELALVREKQAAGGAVRLHEVQGDHWFPMTHEADLLAAMEAELTSLK